MPKKLSLDTKLRIWPKILGFRFELLRTERFKLQKSYSKQLRGGKHVKSTKNYSYGHRVRFCAEFQLTRHVVFRKRENRSGKGKGIVFDNKSKKQTFMKMIELQAGFGMGVKKFRLVWVFEKHKDVNEFVNSGWELGAQTSAAAKTGDKGGAFAGAMSVSPGIWLYQLTDDGLALELTGKGTKYYKDDDLN